jgi:hypothetical protein
MRDLCAEEVKYKFLGSLRIVRKEINWPFIAAPGPHVHGTLISDSSDVEQRNKKLRSELPVQRRAYL